MTRDRADLEAMKDQAKAKLDDYEAKIRRFNWLVLEGEMPKDQYLELKKDIKINRQKAEEQLEKANAALLRPRDIKYAAKRASEILAEQMNLLSTFDQVLEVWDKSAGFANLKNVRTSCGRWMKLLNCVTAYWKFLMD